MKLSEAIRLGAMVGPQTFGTSWDGDKGTCALGAALFAIGQPTELYTSIADHFPEGWDLVVEPVSGNPMYLLSAIRELNDVHCWTREQIADWVQGIEEAHESPRTVDAVARDSHVTESTPVRA